MDIEQEREKFKLDEENQAKIDKYLDNILAVMASENVQPVALIGVDKVYRPYMEWLAAAREHRADATVTRAAVVHIISTAIMEVANQMGGNAATVDQWLSDFMYDLRDELVNDLETLRAAKDRTTQ